MRLWKDIAYGVRVLARVPGFTVVVVLTLALGVGANTAIFSIVNAVLLRPLPFPGTDRLTVVWESRPEEDLDYMFASPPNFADWRDEAASFQGMGAFRPEDLFLVRDAGTVRVRGARVTADLFPTLGVAPALGRGFRPDDDRPGAEPVALIGHDLWQRDFGGDPGIIGRSIRVGDGTRTVVGVMPESFDFPPAIDLEGHTTPRRTQIWVPFAANLHSSQRGARNLTVVGRLADGVSLDQAGMEIRSVAAGLEANYPDTNEGWTTRVVPFEQVVVGEARTGLLVLLGAVGLLLLIATVNVANLMLARAGQREREYAVRTALGAGQRDLVRHAIIESQLLALTGGLLGVVLAYASLGALIRLAPAGVPRLGDATIDGTVLGFAIAVSVITGALFGLVPVLRPVTTSVADLLRGGGRSGATAGRARLRQALVVVEVAMSLALLVGGGLLFRSFLALRGVDTGVTPEQVLTLRVTLPRATYPAGRIPATFRELEARVRALPQVAAAGFTMDVPLATDFQGTSFEIDDMPTPPDENWLSHFTVVTPGYFEAMGIPVVRGRAFQDGDDADAADVVVVNRTVVGTYLQGRDPVGHHLLWQGPRRVVGVVGDVRLELLDEPATPAFYLPLAQTGVRSMSLVARYRGDAAGATAAVQAAIRAVDPRLPIFEVGTMEQILDRRLTQPRFSAFMIGVFSLLALALAAVGVYGLVNFMVSRRRREIAIRIALGSTPDAARGLMVRQGLRLLALGLVLGLLVATLLGRFLASLLYETTPMDPVVFAGVSAFLLLVGLLAAWLPARRAAGVQPMAVLRQE